MKIQLHIHHILQIVKWEMTPHNRNMLAEYLANCSTHGESFQNEKGHTAQEKYIEHHKQLKQDVLNCIERVANEEK